jgi:hypothetical protein
MAGNFLHLLIMEVMKLCVAACRVEVTPVGRGLLLTGMAWSPGAKQHALAFCGDLRDAKHHKDFEPRSHLWMLRASSS